MNRLILEFDFDDSDLGIIEDYETFCPGDDSYALHLAEMFYKKYKEALSATDEGV